MPVNIPTRPNARKKTLFFRRETPQFDSLTIIPVMLFAEDRVARPGETLLHHPHAS
jgi:hypothetical protein